MASAEPVRALVRTVSKDVVRTDRDVALFAGALRAGGPAPPTDDGGGSPSQTQGANHANPALADMLEVLVTAAYARGPQGYTQGMSDLCSPFVYVYCGPAAGHRHRRRRHDEHKPRPGLESEMTAERDDARDEDEDEDDELAVRSPTRALSVTMRSAS